MSFNTNKTEVFRVRPLWTLTCFISFFWFPVIEPNLIHFHPWNVVPRFYQLCRYRSCIPVSRLMSICRLCGRLVSTGNWIFSSAAGRFLLKEIWATLCSRIFNPLPLNATNDVRRSENKRERNEITKQNAG